MDLIEQPTTDSSAKAMTESPQESEPISSAPNPPPPTSPTSTPIPPAPRIEEIAEQILTELKRRNEPTRSDFSVSKLFAGIVQILALASVFIAFLNRGNPVEAQVTLQFAIFFQVFTVALLVMGRQK